MRTVRPPVGEAWYSMEAIPFRLLAKPPRNNCASRRFYFLFTLRSSARGLRRPDRHFCGGLCRPRWLRRRGLFSPPSIAPSAFGGRGGRGAFGASGVSLFGLLWRGARRSPFLSGLRGGRSLLGLSPRAGRSLRFSAGLSPPFWGVFSLFGAGGLLAAFTAALAAALRPRCPRPPRRERRFSFSSSSAAGASAFAMGAVHCSGGTMGLADEKKFSVSCGSSSGSS